MTENILLGAAALLFLLSLLDVLLSGDQKKWLEDRLLRLWNWLDEVKRVQVRSVARAMATARAFKASLAWIFGCLIVLDVVGDVVSIPVSLVAWGDAMLAKEVVLFVVAACVVLVPFALIGIWLGLLYVVTSVVYVVEFYVRRVAEQTKGPFLFVSILVGEMVLVFKFLDRPG
jgi:hypothetical protein